MDTILTELRCLQRELTQKSTEVPYNKKFSMQGQLALTLEMRSLLNQVNFDSLTDEERLVWFEMNGFISEKESELSLLEHYVPNVH